MTHLVQMDMTPQCLSPDYQVERPAPPQAALYDPETPFIAVTSEGFIPPWAEWDFNEWECCTDKDRLLQESAQEVRNYIIYHMSHATHDTPV
jgi:hypothetical protein